MDHHTYMHRAALLECHRPQKVPFLQGPGLRWCERGSRSQCAPGTMFTQAASPASTRPLATCRAVLLLGSDVHYSQIIAGSLHIRCHAPRSNGLMLAKLRVCAGRACTRPTQQRKSHGRAKHLAHQGPPRACKCLHARSVQAPQQHRRTHNAQHRACSYEARQQMLIGIRFSSLIGTPCPRLAG